MIRRLAGLVCWQQPACLISIPTDVTEDSSCWKANGLLSKILNMPLSSRSISSSSYSFFSVRSHHMLPVVCSVCLQHLCVGHIGGSCKTDEPIKMTFQMWTWVHPMNHVSDLGRDSFMRMGTFGVSGPLKSIKKHVMSACVHVGHSCKPCKSCWTCMGPSNRVFDRVHSGTTWPMRWLNLCGSCDVASGYQ